MQNNAEPTTRHNGLPWHDMAMHLVVALLLCCGLVLPLFDSLSVAYHPLQVVLQCAGLLALFQVVGLNRITRRVGTPLLLVGLWFYLTRQSTLVRNLPALFTLLAEGQGTALLLFSSMLSTILLILFAGLCYVLVRQPGGFYMALILVISILLSMWFYGNRSNLVQCLPALAALMMMFAYSGESATPYARTLPIALAAVLAALLFLPSQPATNTFLEQNASRLRDFIYDYLLFTEPRSIYSLTTDGYQPLGQDRLGGPVTLTQRPVMQVETEQKVLLRGTVKSHYTGLAFVATDSSRRYLMIDPRWTSLRQNLLDISRPPSSLREDGIFTPREITVTLVAPGVSTIFVPQRFESLTAGPDMVPYFNITSEVFITRDTVVGDTYQLVAYPFTSDTTGLSPLITASLQYADPAYDQEVRDTYLQLPVSVENDVYTLASRLVNGISMPFEQARAIEQYLRSSFPYTLNQSTPPTHRDFVSWFLLQEQQGYCTSFAASMVILARCAGLPARYVEGYIASPSGGTAYVTSEHAHAWAEVYFDGFGWVAFDATPGSGSGQTGGNPDEPDTPEDQTEQPPDEDPDTPEADPTPAPTDPPAGEEPEPEEDPQNDDADPTPTPEPEDPDNNTPGLPENPDEPPDEDKRHIWPIVVGILLLLLLIAALVLRLLFTSPSFLAGRQADGAARLMIWYRAILRVLTAYGLSISAADSPLKSFEDAENALSRPGLLMPVATTICLLQYGRRTVSPEALGEARFAYKVLRENLKIPQKLRHLWIRLRYGLGDLKSIP